MVNLHADKLQVPIQAWINNVSDKFIYCGGQNHSWIQINRTPIMMNDITQIIGHDRTMLWKHYKIELYSDGRNIRARKPNDGGKINEYNNNY